jgi:hypothetical protein
MLEIGGTMEHVGDDQKDRLHGNAADRVADREVRLAGRGGRDGHDDARNRRTGPEQDCSKHRLAEAGQVREAVGDARHPGADHGNDRAACDEDDDGQGQGPLFG